MGSKKKGGGADSAPQVDPAKAYSDIFQVFKKQVAPGYQNWVKKQPLIQDVQRLSTQGYNELPGMENLLKLGYQAEGANTPALEGPLLDTYKSYLAPILQSGGALTPQLTRQATQEAAARNAAAGMATTNPGIFGEALNRDVYRQQRYGQAFNQAMQLVPQVNALDQQKFGNVLQYALGRQGLRGSTMQDLAAAEQSGIGSFGALFNPTAAGVGSMLNFNANAQAAAQNAQSQKKGNTGGAAIGAIGTIAAAFL